MKMSKSIGFFLLFIVACNPVITERYHWWCDNHRENIGEHNFGKGHLCLDEDCRREATREHGCKGWRAVKVKVQ